MGRGVVVRALLRADGHWWRCVVRATVNQRPQWHQISGQRCLRAPSLPVPPLAHRMAINNGAKRTAVGPARVGGDVGKGGGDEAQGRRDLQLPQAPVPGSSTGALAHARTPPPHAQRSSHSYTKAESGTG
jgi:hypothetical protein